MLHLFIYGPLWSVVVISHTVVTSVLCVVVYIVIS